MSDIKTKEKVKGVRTLDKSKALGQRMKSGLVRTKQKMDDLTDDSQVTAEEYAGDKAQKMGVITTKCGSQGGADDRGGRL